MRLLLLDLHYFLRRDENASEYSLATSRPRSNLDGVRREAPVPFRQTDQELVMNPRGLPNRRGRKELPVATPILNEPRQERSNENVPQAGPSRYSTIRA